LIHACYDLLYSNFRKILIFKLNHIDFLEFNRAIRHKKQIYKRFVNQSFFDTAEYEIVPRDPTLQETPIQKLRRLMFEVQELGEDIEKKKVIL
jgi:hypothetical protein